MSLAVKGSIRMVANAANIVANFAPVPYLSPAVVIIIGMIDVVDKVHFNKRQVRDLYARCEELLYALKDATEGSEAIKIDMMVQKGVALLDDIKHKMIDWRNAGMIKHVLHMPDISDAIRQCNQDIDTFLETFQVTAHMQALRWMTQFDESRRMDQVEIVTYLTNIDNKSNIIIETLGTQWDQQKQFMQYMQNILGNFSQGDRRHVDLGRNLLSVQESSGQLLPNLELKYGEAQITSHYPIGGNGSFDIYEGQYLSGKKCTIKTIRSVRTSPTMNQRFIHEVEIWRIVNEIDRGNNILPFWGACLNDGPHPYMVYPWMQHGDLMTYLKNYPDVNRKAITRRIAEGLKVLHGHTTPIAHGDLRAANICINDIGNPLLADFSLSKIMEDITSVPFTESSGIPDVFRWCAPELLSTERRLAPPADIYAFGMTVLELMTTAHPFSYIKRSPLVLKALMTGERPRRPEDPMYVARGLDDAMWALLQRCWREEPEQRPTIDEVLEVLPVR